MYFKFIYNEKEPKFDSYIKLLKVLENKKEEFYELDKIFYDSYNYEKLIEYEKLKKEKVLEMFKTIIDIFPILNKIPCAIYINGSYARNSITARSDLDLTFFFNKDDIDKYQTLVYLIRYAISKMFDVNIVHIHSFTKNFTTKYRKENNLIEYDENLETDIIWNDTNDVLKIDYPKYQMITEREICEITSIKSIDELLKIIKKRMDDNVVKEWMYTYECIHTKEKYFNIDKEIKHLDKFYDKDRIKKIITNLEIEIDELLKELKLYFNELNLNDKVDFGKFNMFGKRKVTLLINTFATYLRWYYIYNNNYKFIGSLNTAEILNYNSILDISIIKDKYYYYKYLISRTEIWSIKFNHHYEHRSKEIISKKTLNDEYYSLWNNDYSMIKEMTNTFNFLYDEIINIIDIVEI